MGGVVPDNVRFINIQLEDLKALAIRKTGLQDISLEHPYRCCDFKPLYGLIFQDYIPQYTYWGHCDFDMIFGDIYFFLEQYEYWKYDKFLNLGHLSFYKNSREVNHYYTKAGSLYPYTEVLTTDKNFAYDENAGINRIFLKNGFPFFRERLFFDISDIYHRFRLSEFCSLTVRDSNYKKQIFYWSNGKVFRGYEEKGKIMKEERMYIHFKKRPNYNVEFNVCDTNSFYICPSGFIPFNGMPSIEGILSYNSGNVLREFYDTAIYWLQKYTMAFVRRLKKII